MPIIQTTKKLRPRDPRDFYPTPIELCRKVLGLFEGQKFDSILDPGCGTGVWGKVARDFWPNAFIEGIDIQNSLDDYETYDVYTQCSYMLYPKHRKYECIIGSPPYKFAEDFVRKSYELLYSNGTIIFLLRLAFLEGQDRGKDLWREFPPSDVYVCSRRPSFTSNGKTDATAYSIYCWGKRRFSTDTHTYLNWLDWDYDK